MKYYVVYDGNCNLCVNFTKLLESFDRGELFAYIPMQEEARLEELGIYASDCEMGMILLDKDNLERRWQGSEAAEEIANLLPMGNLFVNAYRALPGMKVMGDRLYTQIRDNRYNWFGKREKTYHSPYPFGCQVKKANQAN